MKLNAPKQLTWICALVLVVIALVANFFFDAVNVAFWIACVSAVLLLCATYLSNL